MAGHNKWSKIKHRKAVVDKRRGKVWTKVAKAIIVAAKNGGPDPASNLTLRYAIDEARYANMPRDTIERAIKKGAGGGDTSNYESIRYEGYAPGGVAVIVEALTDNRTRTAADVRNCFAKVGGSIGASGCVAFLFQHVGRLSVDPKGMHGDRVMELALEAGARDVVEPEGEGEAWTVITSATEFQAVKDALERAGLGVTDAEVTMVPESYVGVSHEHAESATELIEQLEDLDDVQRVYTNAELG